MRTHVRFRSELFPPRRPEAEQVNPGVYGEELAAWIRENIGAHGLPGRRPAGDTPGRFAGRSRRVGDDPCP